MKKFLMIFAAMSLALSMAACGNDDMPSQGGAAIDDDGNEIIGTSIDGAGKEVDMDKVEGTELKVDAGEGGSTKAELAGLAVSIDEAKLMDTDDAKLLVITFKVKNKAKETLMFDSAVDVDLTQNGQEVMTTLTNNVEGINVRSGIENIAPGKSTLVQKTYPIEDTETPLSIMAYACNDPAGDAINAVINLK